MKSSASMLMILFVSMTLMSGLAPAWAHDGKPRGLHTAHAAAAFGQPGIPGNVLRTVAIHMSDAMRFEPAALAFKRGETVRLHIINDGRLAHEFALGTRQEIEEHAAVMRTMPYMVRTDASSIRVAPGVSADIVWKFSKKRKFIYACLVPGHHEAGMHGVISVAGAAPR